MRLIRLELYKIYTQKVIYIAFAVFAALYISQFYNELQPATEIEAVQAAYKEYGGVLTEEKLEWAEKTIAASREREQEKNGAAPDPTLRYQLWVAQDIQSVANKQSAFERKRQELEARLLLPEADGGPTEAQRREAVAEAKVREAVGAPDYVMEQTAWKRILLFMNEVGYFFVAILAIVGLAGSFSREYASGMDQLLLSSRFGRSRAVTAKLAAAAIYCASVVLFLNLIVLLLYGVYYGLSGWNQPLVQLFNIFSGTGFGGSIWQFYLLQQLCAIGGCISLGWFVIMLSSWSRNVIIPVLLGGLAFVFPLIFLFMNLPSEALFRIIWHVLRYMEYIQAEYINLPSYYSMFGGLLLYRNGVWINLLLSLAVPVGLLYATMRRKQVK